MGKEQIATWAQGQFIDGPEYRRTSEIQKKEWSNNEKHLVRPSAKGNAICHATTPEDAVWIAERLNIAAKADTRIRELRDLLDECEKALESALTTPYWGDAQDEHDRLHNILAKLRGD